VKRGESHIHTHLHSPTHTQLPHPSLTQLPHPSLTHTLTHTHTHSHPHTHTDYEAVVKLGDGFNGADLRNVCTEAGMYAIRDEREYVGQDDFMKAVRKVAANKKLEGKLDYNFGK